MNLCKYCLCGKCSYNESTCPENKGCNILCTGPSDTRTFYCESFKEFTDEEE